MGLDLYCGELHHTVEYYEEWVFDQAYETGQFHSISWLRSQWFDDPKISPSECNDLVHELIELRQQVADRRGQETIDKLIFFLSRAYRNDAIVECRSD
ncbi:MAG: hypothetical protein AAF889_13585 [Cyanobacteria bacterium P01_D01_bin.73]